MAEAIARHRGSQAALFYSAGTELAPTVNSTAVATVHKLFGITMDTETYYPKMLESIPSPDIVITMGCGVACPLFGSAYREDWNLEDPSGQDEAFFESTAHTISEKVALLLARIDSGEFE